MTAVETMVNKKFKIRIGSKLIGSDSGTKSCELSQRIVMGNDSCQSASMSSCTKSEMVKSHNLAICSSDTLKIKISSMGSNKHELSLVGNGPKKKRRKMDRSVTQHCAMILKQLMYHPAGWVFNQPVDPVKLQIPDYFDIITEPMDLGTVKTKLNNNEYSNADEFAADVRLTFSNAMRYNPPSNNVHIMAKELNDLFYSEWDALEVKWSDRRKNMQQSQNISEIKRCSETSSKSSNKRTHSNVTLVPKRMLSTVEKQKLRDQFLELLRGKVPSYLQGFLRKFGLDLEKGECIPEDVDGFDDEIFWELKKIISSLEARPATCTAAKEPEHVGHQSRVKITHKGTDTVNGSASGTANDESPLGLGSSQCGSCCSMRCKCNKNPGHSSKASPDMSSEGSQNYLDVSMRDHGMSCQSNSQPLESKGVESALNKEYIGSAPQISTLDTTSTSEDGWALLVESQLSPQKALRAAMLKSRFADTILKAKQKALLDHGNKTDPVKLQQEKERLKRQQQEERARIEAQIKASKEAARVRVEAERKMQREREREAARLALQQMVKTVEIDNDHEILKELELISGCSLSDHHSCSGSEEGSEVGSSIKGCHLGKALEELGLYMKDDGDDDYMEDDEYAAIIPSGRREDGEEGEICT